MATANKGRKLPPEPLAADEVRRLISCCSPTSSIGLRNRAMLALLYRSGLRVAEALALRPKDLDAANGCIRILHGKGDKYRVVGLDAGGWTLVQTWLERRSRLGIGEQATVFCTLQGGAAKTAYVRALLPRLARKAGLEKRIHAHGLRHTHAFELLGEGLPLHVISGQLGHKSLATTERYLRHLHPRLVVSAVKSRRWTL